jgi:subtilisin family serine protease
MPEDEGPMSDLLAARPRYIVVFRERSERNVSTLSRVLKAGEAKGMSIRAGATVLESALGFTHVYHKMSVAAADLDDDQLARLRKDEGVRAVVLNEVRSIPRPVGATKGAPTESAAGAASAQAPAAEGTFSWCLRLIGMSPGYQVATGKGVTVAVLDTGIDLTHPDFAGRVEEGRNAKSFVPGQKVQDGHGHGTHCAGVVAGPVSSRGGMRYGVAPEASLVIGKVLSNRGSGSDDKILAGMDWARDQGAQVISMSLGSPRKIGEPYSVAYEQVASTLLADGILVVAAAGNESGRPDYRNPVENPAAAPSIMAVAAVDKDCKVGWFSCAQLDDIGTLDISAPGVDVYSSYMGGGFKLESGTSMAAPHVAGVAALYCQHVPSLRGRALWNTLTSTALKIGDPSDYGAGLVQVPRER